MSNQYGDFTISKNVFDGQCAGQKYQMLLIYQNIHKRIQIPHINLYLNLFCVLGVVLQTILDVYDLFYLYSIVIP